MTERPHKSTTHPEMFFHVFWDSSATARGYKGATVFARKEGHMWYGAIAFCAASDQFDRRVGRSQARRRYFVWRDQQFQMLLGPEKPTYEGVNEIALTWAANLAGSTGP